MIVIGVLAIMLPMASSIGIARFIGWLMIFDSIAQGIDAFRSSGIGRLSWKLMIAALYTLGGVYLLLHPFLAVVALTFALAIFFFVQGVLELTDYLFSRSGRKSSWVLINGFVSIILGGMIWKHWPSSSLWALGQLVGIGMLMTGVTRLIMALAMRRRAAELRNTHVPEVQAA
jgi:uncharacterized membrane protein HdeD (DUF308 family)